MPTGLSRESLRIVGASARWERQRLGPGEAKRS
jgi:hypothetical protein